MITVETDTYISLADARAYVSANALTPLPLVDSEAESLLKRAAVTLDRIYSNRYLGMKETIEQPMFWPRIFAGLTPRGTGEWPGNVVDSDGNPRNFQQVPVEMGQAQVELAVMLAAGTDPYRQPEPFLSAERNKVGSLEQEKQFKSAIGYRADPLYKITLILRPLLANPTGQVAITRGA